LYSEVCFTLKLLAWSSCGLGLGLALRDGALVLEPVALLTSVQMVSEQYPTEVASVLKRDKQCNVLTANVPHTFHGLWTKSTAQKASC